jgi:methyl-accepting chemotaxis protein
MTYQCAMQFSPPQRGGRTRWRLRARIGTLSDSLTGRAAIQLDRYDSAQTYADRAAIATAMLMLLSAFLAFAALRLFLARPLRRLVREVGAVAGGDYNSPIEPAGPREVASIAVAAEQLRVGMLRHSSELVAAQERLSAAAERDRLVADLQQGATARLSLLGIQLSSLATRHPSAQADLLPLVGETDQVMRSLRDAIFAVNPPPP